MKSTILFLALLFTGLGFSQNTNELKLDSLFDLLSDKNLAMGNVAIFQDGKKVYTHSFGYKDIEIRDRGDTHTLYRVGPLLNTFTAVVIMQLIEEGRLRLKTKVAEFFPNLPRASELSIAQLLRQCPKPSSKDSVFQEGTSSTRTRQEFLEHLKTELRSDKQGLDSKDNYVLLSLIAEDLENRSLPFLIEDRIIRPLNLQQTRFEDRIKSKKNEALPYFYEHGNWQTSREKLIKTPLGHGELISTAQEIAKFYSALFTGRLTDASSLAKMIPESRDCGLGFVKSTFRDKTSYNLKGGINNFHTSVAYFPEEKTSVALTINASRIAVSRIFEALLNVYYGYPYPIKRLAIK